MQRSVMQRSVISRSVISRSVISRLRYRHILQRQLCSLGRKDDSHKDDDDDDDDGGGWLQEELGKQEEAGKSAGESSRSVLDMMSSSTSVLRGCDDEMSAENVDERQMRLFVQERDEVERRQTMFNKLRKEGRSRDVDLGDIVHRASEYQRNSKNVGTNSSGTGGAATAAAAAHRYKRNRQLTEQREEDAEVKRKKEAAQKIEDAKRNCSSAGKKRGFFDHWL